MNEETKKAISDYFDVGDFAEYLGLKVEDLILSFPDEVEDVLGDILELMGLESDDD